MEADESGRTLGILAVTAAEANPTRGPALRDAVASAVASTADFDDFPPCPFGQSFSMLGFDTAEQSYVWLVTSILRDSRLERVLYQGADVPDNE